MPTFSVTLIGIIVAIIFVLTKRSAWDSTLLRGFIGAWVGFIIGALIGVTIDAISGSGVFVAYVGHTMALVGAYLVASGRVVALTKR